MRRPPITAILTAGACALGVAAPAAAQDSAGQRYLAWPTKGAGASASRTPDATAPVAYVANPAADAPRRRAPIIPHGGFGRMPDTAPAQNLTPASAWLGPNAPTYQPVAPPQPQPQPYAAPAPTPWSRDLAPPASAPAPAYAAATALAPYTTPTRTAPQPQPQPVYASAEPAYAPPAEVAPTPQPPVAYAPAPMPDAVPPAPTPTPTEYYATRPEPAPLPAEPAPPPAPTVAPTPAAPEAPAFDPMAPRRDAPIFRLQRAAPSEPAPAAPVQAAPVQPQAAPAPQAQTQAQPQPQPLQAAPQEGARYYSLHRQAGRQPDATPLPQAVYLDALPVDLVTPPASADLAEPPAQPALIRNSSGRLQAAPDTEVQDQP